MSRNTAKTRDRLLQAAIAVFATEGVVGATTREIAQQAGVNEVTLFRHFQTKEQLLGAVAEHISTLTATALADRDEWTQDLGRDLLHYARLYDNLLEAHEALVRMFIGEAQRHPHQSLQVLQQYFLPLREQITTYLQHGVEQGTVRADLDLPLAVDQLTGMLLAGMLRRHVLPVDLGNHRDRYVEGCVDLFVRGISPIPASVATASSLASSATASSVSALT